MGRSRESRNGKKTKERERERENIAEYKRRLKRNTKFARVICSPLLRGCITAHLISRSMKRNCGS